MSRIICIFNDCFSRAHAEDLCIEHYHQFIFEADEYKNSVPIFVAESKKEIEYIMKKYGGKGCVIYNCGVKTKGRLFCKKHTVSFNDHKNNYGMDLESFVIMNNRSNIVKS
ncbi:hypothetical protein ACFSTA_20345 [Ornithinibacillus salinisoli]|uniref:Uncharacterized protein n=1 Tax=Ornithinibacillus salinisoli TaxID=1848459 RepID=A0ABW4W4F3_9BACI